MLPRMAALLMALMVGCSGTPRVVRAERGTGNTLILRLPRAAEVQPVELRPDELASALRTMARQVHLLGTPRQTVWRAFQLDELSGDYLFLSRDKKLVPLGASTPLEGALTDEEELLASDYMGWCSRVYGFQGDCLGGALVGGRYRDLQGRYVLALALSKSPVVPEMQAALGEMVSLQAVLSAALWTISTVLFLLALPEPITKGLAAALAVALILWVGVETLYNLVTGWFQLMEEVKGATTFVEIRAAGEKYGRLIGRDAARVLALLAVAAISQTAQGFTAKVQTLPGSAQVAAQSEAQAGFSLSAAGLEEEVTVTAEGFSVTLPPGAVAMAAKATRGSGKCIETHHIATICNDTSTLRGGPWTPRFREIFAQAKMKLDDPVNRMPLQGHYGPHPEQYHRIVHRRLLEATRGCRSVQECQAALKGALKDLAEDISTPGSELNLLVTRSNPR